MDDDNKHLLHTHTQMVDGKFVEKETTKNFTIIILNMRERERERENDVKDTICVSNWTKFSFFLSLAFWFSIFKNIHTDRYYTEVIV